MRVRKTFRNGAIAVGFSAAVKDTTLELMVYDDISAPTWYSDEGVSAKGVKGAIDDAGEFSRVLVRINSPGGDVFEGVAIFNLLRSLKKPVDVVVDGLAASSASVVAMAGDTRTMGPNALLMIHNAWTGCVGYASEMRQMADVLDKVSDCVATTYVNVTKQGKPEILALMDAETWMTAEEAVAGGFATGIVEEAPAEDVMAYANQFKSLRAMKNLPAKLKALIGECECDCPECLNGMCDECSRAGCSDANCTDCPMQFKGNKTATPADGTMGEATPTDDGMNGTASTDLRERTLRLLDRYLKSSE